VLSEASRGGQVVCITHLPQVAAFADRHHRVEKRVAGGRTHTVVTPLEGEEDRRREVARMMAGATVTSSALDHAAALLAAARRPPVRADARRGGASDAEVRGARRVTGGPRSAARRVSRAG
jgi:DNA repair protein RecN (Recombination protein N)